MCDYWYTYIMLWTYMESSNGFKLLYKGPLVINTQESMTLVMVRPYMFV